jgi:hypothetical protein
MKKLVFLLEEQSMKEVSGSQNISRFMDIENNRSHSFNVFISGVKKIYA